MLANDTFENIGHSITLVDGLAITADGPAVNVTHGTVALDVSGRLIFTPARSYNGPAAFTYTVSSGGVMESATVHVAVNSANLASFALEVLGLSKAEAELIAPSSPPSDADIYSYWGLSRTATTIFDAASGRTLEGTSPRALLQNVAIMLQQSRLSFEELQAVLEARFVAQDGKAPLRIEPQTTCKPSEMWLPTLTAGHLDRIHRFARLWRKLGWTMRDLDLAIQAFGGQLTPETLISLSRLQRLREQLELPVASLVGGLHLLETQPWTDHLTEGAPVHPSLYATIFQREAVRAVSDFADFALQSDGKELKNTPIRGISVHAIYIGACLRIKASVVADWVSGTDGLGIVDKLDLANLSRLTAAADLCRALGIDPKNFAQHLKLYGAPIFPFQSGLSAHDRAEAMLKFVERFRFVEQSGVDAETLCYLLKHEITPGSNIHIDAKRLKQLASAARDAVRSILDAPVKIHTLPLTQAEAEADHNEAAEAARAIRLAREDAAIAALATGLDGARELVDELLRKRLRHPSDPVQWGIDALLAPAFTTSDVAHSPTAAAPPNAVLDPVVKTKVDAADKAVEHVLVRLHKTLLICDALKLSRTDLSLLRASTTDPHGFTVLDFNSLPVASGDAPTSITGFEQLLALTQLRGLASNAGDLLHEYATLTFPSNLPVVWKERVVVLGGEEIRIPESAPVRWHPGAAHQVLTTGLTLTQAEVQAAAQQLRITTAEQYRNPITLTRLINLLIALKQLGATVEQARDLTAPSPSDAAAIGARELLHGKYGVSQWHNLIKPIADKLRERQRNALVDFLVAHKGLRGADDLYERYLIDVQTGSCLKTTRLLQATAAAQLFVQRVLLNLEDGASLSDDKRNRWEWMRSYRVWEANRKVFLFPENWLLTDLRDDKTATFRQMESALIEQESSPEITRAALLGYLEELSDLAQISVIAMYQDQRIVEQDEAGNDTVEHTLYVIGRTPDQPYRYFWRSCTNFGSDKMSWSGWEALDLDNGNDFIMPFVFEGDLHVAWPIFRKTKDDNDKLLWEVQLAWTRRTNKGWIKRKIGHAQLRVNRLENIEAPASFAFRFGKEVFLVPGSAIQRESIIINCYAATDNTPTSLKPDPSLLENTVPDGYEPVVEEYWNVNCDVRGVVYHWATINNQGGKFYQGIGNVRVDAHTRRHDSDGGGGNNIYLNPSVTTDPDGNFSFNFTAKVPVPGDLKNGAPGMGTGTGYGVENSYSITLTFYIRGHRPVTRTCRLLKNGNERYLYWTWNINYGVENQELAEIFRADRKVTYQSTGLFIFETGKDLRFDPSTEGALLPGPVPSLGLTIVSPLIFSVSPTSYSNEQRDMPVDGNRFVAKKTKDVHSIDSIALGAEGTLVLTPTITFPVFVTHATQGQAPGTTPESPVWYLQDNNGSSYLQKRDDTWHRWADGQAFASSYRTAATPSTTRLFSMEVQTALVDPIADNFLRPAPYANYNWELFLHAPLAIADYLARQQRFADARHWLHCVFDPTRPLFEGLTQFWRFLPFKNATTPDSISKLLTWLANPSVLTAEARAKFQADFGHQIDEWKKNPFMPHVIARLRPSAYQWHTFFAYLEVLIGWGDQLFRRDTRESVNEATLLYVLAAKLLGARPRVIPPPTPPPPDVSIAPGKQA